MNIVLDTNVLLSSTLWQGSVAQKLLLKLILSGIEIFCSEDIISEYKKVLKRDFSYSDDEANYIIAKVRAFAKFVETTEKLDVVKDDPDDNKIIECATTSWSEYIITYDKHLLRIKEFKGIGIVTPEEMLKTILP